ncbi:MAG: cytochrome c3 family protein [Desulfobacterales bacterium]|nr:cytochrome c3 family protein [Desulfobacterales bacterium]
MKKVSVLVICLALVFAMGTVLDAVGSQEEELCVPLGELELQAPDGANVQRSSVMFPHGLHFNYSCQQCHHQWKGGVEGLNCTTSGCHDKVETPRNNPDEKILYFKEAYHELCIGCHRQIKAENRRLEMSGQILKEKLPNSGPTGCTECHPEW